MYQTSQHCNSTGLVCNHSHLPAFKCVIIWVMLIKAVDPPITPLHKLYSNQPIALIVTSEHRDRASDITQTSNSSLMHIRRRVHCVVLFQSAFFHAAGVESRLSSHCCSDWRRKCMQKMHVASCLL